jgi:malate dehydrogenase (oxaloacetate-decarboxylating)(NADP+)
VVVSRARSVSDEMFLAAARTLAAQVSESDLERGRLFPSLARIRQVSAQIAFEVASIAYDRGLAGKERPPSILEDIQDYVFQPIYPHYA